MSDYLKMKNEMIKDKLDNKEDSGYSNALVFAIKNDIFPICDLHFEVFLEFEDDFNIIKNAISDIYIKLQNYHDNEKEIGFSQIDLIFDTYGVSEMRKVDICRYFYLSNKFKNSRNEYNFWETLFENESYDENYYLPITKDFKLEELI